MRRSSRPTPTEAHIATCADCSPGLLCEVGRPLLCIGMQAELRGHYGDHRKVEHHKGQETA